MARATGMRLDIDGLEEMLRGIKNGSDLLNEVMRDILRGPFGSALLREMKARASDYKRSTHTLKSMKVFDDGREGVQVGIRSDDKSRHPYSPRANAYSIGVWLESGTKPHLIPTRVSRYNRLRIGGRVVSRVTHPGTPRRNIVRNSLKAYRSDYEREIVRELERRLGRKMNMSGGL